METRLIQATLIIEVSLVMFANVLSRVALFQKFFLWLHRIWRIALRPTILMNDIAKSNDHKKRTLRSVFIYN